VAFLVEDGIGGLIQLLIAALIIGGAILEGVLRKRAARRQEEEQRRQEPPEEGEEAPVLDESVDDAARRERLRHLSADTHVDLEEGEVAPVPIPVAPRPMRAPPREPPIPTFRLVEEADVVVLPSPKPPQEPPFAHALSIEERLARLGRRPLTSNQRAFVMAEVFGKPRHIRLFREGAGGLVHRV
jgi:hypothetical protein